jgi:hypothetical protein
MVGKAAHAHACAGIATAHTGIAAAAEATDARLARRACSYHYRHCCSPADKGLGDLS